MLETMIAQTLKYRNFVVLGVLAMVAFGVYSYLTLPIDAFPDVTNVQVEVLSTAPGLSAMNSCPSSKLGQGARSRLRYSSPI